MAEKMKISLVLSGGGAKGAYQIGVFKALSEYGLLSKINTVSGCSIGTLNALLLATRKPILWRFTWNKLAKMSANVKEKLVEANTGGKAKSSEGFVGAFKILTSLPRVLSRHTMLYACAYNVKKGEPEYFCLNDYSPEEAAVICAASCAHPAISPYVNFRGVDYCDGGMVPEGSDKTNGDKIPTRPLMGIPADMVIISYLVPTDKSDLSVFSEGTKILELYPSRPLEKYSGEGTMNFTPAVLAEHRKLGYADTKKTLEKYFKK